MSSLLAVTTHWLLEDALSIGYSAGLEVLGYLGC